MFICVLFCLTALCYVVVVVDDVMFFWCLGRKVEKVERKKPWPWCKFILTFRQLRCYLPKLTFSGFVSFDITIIGSEKSCRNYSSYSIYLNKRIRKFEYLFVNCSMFFLEVIVRNCLYMIFTINIHSFAIIIFMLFPRVLQ